MRLPALAGVSAPHRGQGAAFARPSDRLAGNSLPPETGTSQNELVSTWGSQRGYGIGPGPNHTGGQLGANDGTWGVAGDRPPISPAPRVVALGEGQESFRRWGIQGFNDRLTAKDRHAYWDTGHQVQGTDFTPASSPPNTYNDPMQEPPRPDLRTINRTVSYQKGTDTTRNQDDLSRPYTWLGEQGSGWISVNGGVPGLYQPYGTRGGIPLAIVSPAGEGQPGDGPHRVWSGPPHGLHSYTTGDRLLTTSRYVTNVQMRPVRIDRPSNSPQAGQSFSQTVPQQGAAPTSTSSLVGGLTGQQWISRITQRGWLGTGQ
jgi:hypothetical protein